MPTTAPAILTNIERVTLARWYLGGVDAVRCPSFMAAPRTIDALVRKGMLDRDGLTSEGRRVGQEQADGEHAATTTITEPAQSAAIRHTRAALAAARSTGDTDAEERLLDGLAGLGVAL